MNINNGGLADLSQKQKIGLVTNSKKNYLCQNGGFCINTENT